MAETRKLRVFICHSSQDKPIVRELYQRLGAEGWIDPWLDEEKLLPGQDWDMEIEKAVEAADAVIVCLSNNSVTREGYIQRELKFVLDIALEKPEGVIFIIPLRLDNVQPPRRLRAWQYADYFPEKRRQWVYGRLVDSLQARMRSIGIEKKPQLPKVSSLLDDIANKTENDYRKLTFDTTADEMYIKNKIQPPRTSINDGGISEKIDFSFLKWGVISGLIIGTLSTPLNIFGFHENLWVLVTGFVSGGVAGIWPALKLKPDFNFYKGLPSTLAGLIAGIINFSAIIIYVYLISFGDAILFIVAVLGVQILISAYGGWLFGYFTNRLKH